jgi:archaemetzincin
MKTINFIAAYLLITLAFSCKEKTNDKSLPKTKTSRQQKVIVIQPYSDLSLSQAEYIITEIKKVCPNVKVNTSIPLPPTAYYAKNNRYRADSLIAIQRRIANGKYTLLGLTSKDISTTKGNTKDFGVMGLGFCPGTACVVSTYRLRGKNRMEKFRKVTLHELAHTEGLPHCPDPHCYMRDAKGKDYLDEEIDFCKICKPRLINKGWKL